MLKNPMDLKLKDTIFTIVKDRLENTEVARILNLSTYVKKKIEVLGLSLQKENYVTVACNYKGISAEVDIPVYKQTVHDAENQFYTDESEVNDVLTKLVTVELEKARAFREEATSIEEMLSDQIATKTF